MQGFFGDECFYDFVGGICDFVDKLVLIKKVSVENRVRDAPTRNRPSNAWTYFFVSPNSTNGTRNAERVSYALKNIDNNNNAT
jgi:hypothetical protein